MQATRFAHAADGDWGQLAKSCADQLAGKRRSGNGSDEEVLGILYVTDHLAGDLSSILTFLRERTGLAHWIGTVGIGICCTGTEYFDRPAVVAMTLPLPAGSLRLTPGISEAAELRTFTDGLGEVMPGLGIVHGDPRNPETADLVAGLSHATSSYLVGGLSASRSEFGQIADHVTEGGISGALIDAAVPVAAGLTQGCSPIGSARTVSGSDDTVLQELDGGSPQEALEADLGLGVEDEEFMSAVQDVHVAILVPGSDTGDYLVRNLTGIDPQSGWLAVGDSLSHGDRVMFCRRNPEAAERDLRRMLEDLRQRAGQAPRAGVYHSCVARGPNLFDGDSRELEMITETLGTFPLVGFFGNGEICHDRLYGYTGVLTLFL
ncbi:MAG: FIST C-terminal domain-containing protein [Alphaproteobacteria bacterium]|nr:FIST C-terminal domain-containing protein [Alphaproteobacteria bacterium]